MRLLSHSLVPRSLVPRPLLLLAGLLAAGALAGCGTGAEAGSVPGQGDEGPRFDHELVVTPPDLRGLPSGTVLVLEVVEAPPAPARPGERVHLRLVESVRGMGERGLPAGTPVLAVTGRDPGTLEIVELRVGDARLALRAQVESVMGPGPAASSATSTATPAATPAAGGTWPLGTGIVVLLTAPVALP